jgi:hypothetical protein
MSGRFTQYTPKKQIDEYEPRDANMGGEGQGIKPLPLFSPVNYHARRRRRRQALLDDAEPRKGNNMNVPTKWLKIFTIGLINVIAIQSTHVAAVSSLSKNKQDEEIVVAEGTPLSLVTAQEISSKAVKAGDPVNFKVDEDLVVKGHVVVSKGTPATGSVINAEKSGRMGKAGKLGIQVESTMTVGGQPLRLRAAKGKEGDDKTNSTAALSMLVSGFFLLKKGKDATIKEGTKVEVYLDEEKRFRVVGSSLVAESAGGGAANPNVASVENAGGDNKGAEGMVTVYIYRPSKLVGKALEPTVFCDGVELARMDNGRFLTLRLKPGKHLIHMTDKKKGFDVNMGRDQEYYFRVGIEMGMWKGQGKLMLEDKEKAAPEIKKLKPLDSSKIKDHTMVIVESDVPKSN